MGAHRWRRRIPVASRAHRVPIALCIVLGGLVFGEIVGTRLARVESIAAFDFVPDRDWPMLVAAAALVWILRRGIRDASSTAHDSPILLGRAASALLIALGEMLAGVLGFFREANWPGHAVALVGLALVAAATGALAWRRRWLDRVREGRVSGWTIRPVVPGEPTHGLAHYVTSRDRSAAPHAVLVRLDTSPRAYREGPRDVPVALA